MTIDRNGWPATARAVWSQTFNRNGSKTLITWCDEKITVGGLTAREQLLLKLDGLASTPKKPRHARSIPFERNGEAALADLSERIAPKRPWFVRAYYISMGGQRCYAEFGGLTECEATTCAIDWTSPDQTRRWYPDEPRTMPEPVSWAAKYEAPKPKHGWKKVIFPSELCLSDSPTDSKPQTFGVSCGADKSANHSSDARARTNERTRHV